MKRFSVIAVIWLAFAACNGPKQGETAPTYEVDLMPKVAEAQAGGEEKVIVDGTEEKTPSASPNGHASERKFIKTGRIEFETDDAAKTRGTIMAALKASNGYVSRDDEERNSSDIAYTIVVHVPVAGFDAFLASATQGITDFRQKSISNEDVTAQYVDAESRLKTKKDIENRYRALLAKANSVKDILEIERELGEIRTDIEATEAQFRQLNANIRYSTLHIVFFKPVGTSHSFLGELADAFGDGVDNLRSFTVVLVAVWPFVLAAIAIMMTVGRIRKRRKMDTKEKAELPSE